jgi:hypothetical protein
MKPKEKAEELIKKYSIILYNDDLPKVDIFREEINELKELALIAVDEIQEVLMTDELYNAGNLSFERIDNYWEEVKQEIEKTLNTVSILTEID